MTTPTTVQVRLQIRADTAANWASVNPVLLANELGLESDTKKFKIGNGSSTWGNLAYFPSIVSGGTVLGNLEIGTTGTLTFEGSTADGFETTLGVVDPTADRTILLPNQSGTVVVGGNASITNADIAANAEIAVSKLADGAARQVLQTDAAGTGVEWTDNVDIPGTLDVTGVATFDSSVTITGDLTVNGTTTNINTQNLVVEDKNVILGDVATPTDITADGGGITLKGATDKTINWVDSTDAWTSSERFSVPLGSASAPSLTFTGDPNTGIYSPGADQVAISTSSSERIRIGANGEIGLGGANYGTNGQVLTSSGTGAAPTWTTPSAGNTDKIEEGNTSAEVIDTGSDGRFVVTTEGTERLRVTSTGLVGIGTSSPAQRLHVSGSNAGGFQVTNADNSDAISLFVRGGNPINSTTDNAVLHVGQRSDVSIITTGRVGIGTSTPGKALEVAVGSSSALRISRAGAGEADFSVDASGNVVYDSGIGDGHIFRVDGGVERCRLDSSGRLLVGTSSGLNDARLQVVGNTGGDPGRIDIRRNADNPTANSEIGTIRFSDLNGASGQYATIQCFADAASTSSGDLPGRLVFSTTSDNSASPSERLRIASTGALGLSGANYGSSGQVLTSQGSGAAPQWATPSGGLTLLSTITASAVNTVDFTSGFSSSYIDYFISIDNFSQNSGELHFFVSTDGGSSYVNTGYRNAGAVISQSSIFSQVNGQLKITSWTGVNSEGIFRVSLYGAYATTRKLVVSDSSFNLSGSIVYGRYTTSVDTTSVVNAFRIKAEGTGNITGTFRLFGVTKI